MSDVTEDEFIDIGSRMAQELQDFIDDAEQAGCVDPLPSAKALIDEWEAIFKRTNLCWQNAIKDDNSSDLFALLAEENNDAIS